MKPKTHTEPDIPRNAVALQHLYYDGPGLLAGPLRERGWILEIREPLTDPAALDGLAGRETDLLIVLGGAHGVYESDQHRYLREEIALLRLRMERGFPVLGLCLGAQLMAAALGGEVRRGGRLEIGWQPVRILPEGRLDPVFSALFMEDGTGRIGDQSMTLQWHQDTFSLPAREVNPASSAPVSSLTSHALPPAHASPPAPPLPVEVQLLASSDAYREQAFRVGPSSYGIQFHPEVDPDELPVWIKRSTHPLTGPPGPPTAGTILQDAVRYGPGFRRRTREFLHRYLAGIESARGGAS